MPSHPWILENISFFQLPLLCLQEKFVTNGLPEFEFHRFALSDVYNFFF